MVSLTIAGHLAAWRYADSAAFKDWIGQRPWQRDGGVAVVRISGPKMADIFSASLRRLVFGFDGGVCPVSFYTVSSYDLAKGIMPALRSCFGLLHDGDNDRTEKIFDSLLDSTAPVIYMQADGSTPPNLLPQAEQLYESIAKSSTRHSITLILAHPPEVSLLTSRGLDLVHGSPVESFMDAVVGNSLNAWPVYLHHRIAWECAGRCDDALSLSNQIDHIQKYDDNAFEAILNQWGKMRFEQLDDDVRDSLWTWLRDTEANPGAPSKEVLSTRLTWPRLGFGKLAIVPWAARALLLEGECGEAEWLLRDSLACAPVACSIITACQALETQMRHRFLSLVRQHPDGPSDELQKADERFRDENGIICYPNELLPNQDKFLWRLISTGELLEKLRHCDRSIDVSFYHRLRELRNVLAHGHYVRWRHIEEIMKLLNWFGI